MYPLQVKEREQTIRNLNTKVNNLQAKIAELKRHGNNHQGGGGYARGPGRSRGRGAGRGAVAAVEYEAPAAKKGRYEDPDYVKDRLPVCREWNTAAGCVRPQGSCTKSHCCNKPAVGNPKACCKGNHTGSIH